MLLSKEIVCLSIQRSFWTELSRYAEMQNAVNSCGDLTNAVLSHQKDSLSDVEEQCDSDKERNQQASEGAHHDGVEISVL